MNEKCRIAVAGTGYVGLSDAILLAQHNQVVTLNVDASKVALLQRQLPIEDREISKFLKRYDINFVATLDKQEAYVDTDFVIIAPPQIMTLIPTILIPKVLKR